jgi:hypothetical protein
VPAAQQEQLRNSERKLVGISPAGLRVEEMPGADTHKAPRANGNGPDAFTELGQFQIQL